MGGYEGRLLEGILRCNKGNSASNVSTITLFDRYKYISTYRKHINSAVTVCTPICIHFMVRLSKEGVGVMTMKQV
jgi:hypothetical protein